MLKEFKEFAMRGNVVDMAVGIIIGAAFGTIVKSLVSDVIMPPIGLALGNVDFANLFIILKQGAELAGPYASLADAQAAGAVTLNYGTFINTIISFIIVALAVFMLIRSINKLKRKEEAPPPEPTTKECPLCFSTIPIKATRCPMCTSELKSA
jgi:large conductance mechanosensitive channel